MKKGYESPKAEKIEFGYTDAIVASGTGCINGTYLTQYDTDSEKCLKNEEYHNAGDNGN